MPNARVSFRDSNDQLLLDSTLNADNLVFLMRACARIVQRLLESSIPISKANLLSLSDPQRIPKRVYDVREALEIIEEIGRELGIDFPEQSVQEPLSRGRPNEE